MSGLRLIEPTARREAGWGRNRKSQGERASRSGRKQTALLSALRNQGASRRSGSTEKRIAYPDKEEAERVPRQDY